MSSSEGAGGAVGIGGEASPGGGGNDDAPATSRSGQGSPSGRERAFVYRVRDMLSKLPLEAMPPIPRAVLLVLAAHAENDGSDAWPSIARIRSILGYSVSVIVGALGDLARRQWIARHKRFDPRSGAQTSTSYDVRLTGEAWPATDVKARRRERSRLPPGGRPPPAAGHNRAVADDGSLLCVTQAPLPQDTNTPCRVTQAPLVSDTNEVPMRIPREDPKEVPGALAGAHEARGEAVGLPADPPPGGTKASEEPAGRKRKKPCTEIPADWAPKVAAFTLGASLGFSRERVESEAAMFVDRSKAKGQMWVEWDAAFHNALRLAKKWEIERGAGAPRGQASLPLSADREPMRELPRAPPPKGWFDKPPSIVRGAAEIQAKLARGEFVETDPMKVLEEVCKKIAPARVDP